MKRVKKEGYKSPEGFHRHQCPRCKTVWEHRDFLNLAKDECQGPAATHDCPRPGCGGEETWQYLGPIAPVFSTSNN
jgi:hypothetical protein